MPHDQAETSPRRREWGLNSLWAEISRIVAVPLPPQSIAVYVTSNHEIPRKQKNKKQKKEDILLVTASEFKRHKTFYVDGRGGVRLTWRSHVTVLAVTSQRRIYKIVLQGLSSSSSREITQRPCPVPEIDSLTTMRLRCTHKLIFSGLRRWAVRVVGIVLHAYRYLEEKREQRLKWKPRRKKKKPHFKSRRSGGGWEWITASGTGTPNP